MADEWDRNNLRPGKDTIEDNALDQAALKKYNDNIAANKAANDIAMGRDPYANRNNTGDIVVDPSANAGLLAAKKKSPAVSLYGNAAQAGGSFWKSTATVTEDDLAVGGFAALPDDIKRVVIETGKKWYGKDWNMIDAPDLILKYGVSNAKNEGVSLIEGLRGLLKYKPDSGPSGGGSGGPFTQVNKNVQLTNAGTARRLVNSALATYLGRQASDDEIKQFKQALNAEERKSPTTTVTKGYSSGSSSTSTSKSKGGMDQTDFAERYALAQEGSAEFQVATKYMDILTQAIEDPTRII